MGVGTRLLVVAVLVGAILAVPTLTGATSQYTLSMETTIDGPTRTVSLEGTNYTVTKMGRVPAGTNIQVTADAPENAEYDLYLYNSDRNIIDTVNMEGSGTATFRTQSAPPGSYLVAVYADGRFPKILPVVIAGYTVDGSAPESIGRGASLSVTVTLDNITEAPAPSAVEVTLVRNDQVVWRTRARQHSPQRFTLTRRMTAAPGTYALLVNIRGQDKILGHSELLGASDRRSITVTNQTVTTTTLSPTPEDSGQAGGPPPSPSPNGVLTPVSPGSSATTEATGSIYVLHLIAILAIISAIIVRYWPRERK